jgi:hypothetical protein
MFPWFWDFLLVWPKTMNIRDFQENLTWEKFFVTVFEYIGQFLLQNDVFKLQDVFSELMIRVYLENGLGSFRHFLLYRFETNQRCLKDSKTVLKTRLKSKPKKSHILWFS